MSNRTLTIADLRQSIANAETEILLLERQLTDAIVSKRATGSLSSEIGEISEARDFLKARLARLEGEPDHG